MDYRGLGNFGVSGNQLKIKGFSGFWEWLRLGQTRESAWSNTGVDWAGLAVGFSGLWEIVEQVAYMGYCPSARLPWAVAASSGATKAKVVGL